MVQEVQDLLAAAGHLGGQGALGVVVKAQQLGLGVAALEDFRHHRGVVPLAGIRALVGGAGHKGLIDFPAQIPVVAVGHDREEAGEIQGDDIAVPFLLAGGLFGAFNSGLGDAGELIDVGDMFEPVLGSIQHVITELVGQLGQLPGQLGILLFLVFRQVDTTQMEIPEGVFHRLALGFAQVLEVFSLGQLLVGVAECRILAHLGAVLGELLQAVFVNLAQLVVVHHAVQVRNH